VGGSPSNRRWGPLMVARDIGVDTSIVVPDDRAYVTHSLRSGGASPEGWAPSGTYARQRPVGCSSRTCSKIAGPNQDVVVVTVTKLSSRKSPADLSIADLIHD
jgi:hypothetical protein